MSFAKLTRFAFLLALAFRPDWFGLASARTYAATHPPSAGIIVSPMSIGTEFDSSSYKTSNAGGYWSQRAYSGWAFNKEFNQSNTDPHGGSPAISLLSIAYANGTPKDVVGQMGIAIANANNSSLFGFNFIATSTGNKSAVFRGGEIDVEPAKTDTPLPGSAGLYFNAFSKPIPGAVIQSNGIGGGSFANGFSCGGVTGTCLLASRGSSSASLVNASLGTYSSSAFVTGTGIAQGFAWGTGGSGNSPYTYGDFRNRFVLQLGRDASFQVRNSSGASILFEVGQTGVATVGSVLRLQKTTVAALPICGAQSEGELAAVTDAATATFNAPVRGRGSNHTLAYCNGTSWTIH